MALGGGLGGGDYLLARGLEFLIGNLALAVQLLEIAEREAGDWRFKIVVGPDAFSQPHHRVSGSEHDNEQKDADENDVACACFVIREILAKREQAWGGHSCDFMKAMRQGQHGKKDDARLAGLASPRSDRC